MVPGGKTGKRNGVRNAFAVTVKYESTHCGGDGDASDGGWNCCKGYKTVLVRKGTVCLLYRGIAEQRVVGAAWFRSTLGAVRYIC